MSDGIKSRTVYLLKRTDKEDDGADIYVGITSLSLPQRLTNHRQHSKISNSRLYKRMDEVGLQKWEIVPLVVVPSCGKIEILNFEKSWIGLLNPDLNINSPIKENDEKARERVKKHYSNNLESKKNFCSVCDKAFGYSGDLKRHLKSLKHSYNYMNSVD